MQVPYLCRMKTLKDKILLLDLKPRSAPLGVTADRFGKWLRAIKDDKKIPQIAEAVVSIVCDIELLLLKVRRGSASASGFIYVKSEELSAAIDELLAADSIKDGSVSDVDSGGKITATGTSTSHPPVNCMPGTFTTKDGVLVFNLDGTFWTGGSDGMLSINGVTYEYPVGKKFGNFKKVR